MTDPTEGIHEIADAVGEVAKTTGKAFDTAQRAGGWLDRIFGAGIENFVARKFSDRQMALRIEAAIFDWRRLLELLHKTASELHCQGVDTTRLVPPKIALPLLEHATIEHEDDLHSKWATMLANALSPSAALPEKKFVSTLAEMTATDVVVFEQIYEKWKLEDKKAFNRISTVKYGPGVDAGADDISIITLARLALITPSAIEFKTYSPPGHDDRYGDYGSSGEEVRVYGNLDVVTVTAFGQAFYKAVSTSATS